MPPKKSSSSAVAASKAKSNQQTTPKSPVALIVLSVVSIAFALFIHYKGVWWNPYAENLFTVLDTHSAAQIKRNLSLKSDWPGTDVFERTVPNAWKFLLVLILFFQDALGSRSGQAILIILTSGIMPIIAFSVTEALKDGRNRVFNIPLIIFVTGLGQIMMVGAATPLVLVPVYAYTRYVEVAVSQVFNSLTLATIPLTAFTPLHTEAFAINNIIFQFYPLLWLPLVFLPTKNGEKAVTSKTGSASAREKPRLDASSSYRLLSVLTVPLYYFGLRWGGKDLVMQTFNGLAYNSSGAYLLFWDAIGVFGALYLIVLVDSFVDEAKVKQGARRVHARRLLLEDFILGLPGPILLGPGWAAARYFQRREILAEKARFGQKTV